MRTRMHRRPRARVESVLAAALLLIAAPAAAESARVVEVTGNVVVKGRPAPAVDQALSIPVAGDD